MYALSIKDLKKTYRDGTIALRGISIDVEEGELFSLLGPNGAGKTTTIRIVVGLSKRTSGSIRIFGVEVDGNPKSIKSTIGVVPQTINLDTDLTAEENLMVHGILYSMGWKKMKRRIHELLSFAELEDKAKTPVKNLSGGQKRRLLIVRALMHRPKLLFLDEPTVGLDPSIRRKIWALIKNIQSSGTTVLITTHYIEEAEFLSDRVAFMDEGRIVKTGTPESLMGEIGSWAVDVLRGSEFESFYFKEREDAELFLEGFSQELRIRRVNLEDAFIKYTGKKLDR